MNTILIISYFNSCKKKFCQANAIQTAFICYSSVKKNILNSCHSNENEQNFLHNSSRSLRLISDNAMVTLV